MSATKISWADATERGRTFGDILDDNAEPMLCEEYDLAEIEQGLAHGCKLNNTGVRDLIFTIRQLHNGGNVLDGETRQGRAE